ncbi:hypothetical protein GCM10023317_87320 [Actinopolymorpha pittospori]
MRMTEKAPGWYTDPSGIPRAFRWWDGRQWTQAISEDQQAPPPASAPPVVPPGTGQQDTREARPGTGSSSGPTGPDSSVPPGSNQPDQFGAAAPSTPQGAGFPPHGTPAYGAPSHGLSAYGAPSRGPAVPPPAGAPGPGYLPPWGERQGGPAGPSAPGGPTEVLTHGADPTSRRVGVILVGVAIVAVVAAVVSYLTFVRGDDPAVDAAASPTPIPTQPATPPAIEPLPSDEPTTPPATPSPTAPASPSGTPTPSVTAGEPDPSVSSRLVFAPLPNPWTRDDGAAMILLQGVAQTQVTEERYDGEENWVAFIGTGAASPDWYSPSDSLAANAERAATWFARAGFPTPNVDRATQTNRSLQVDGHNAHLLRQHFTYRIPQLRSQGETVSIVVVDLGADKAGILVASIPDTNPELRQDAEKAISSLRVVD